MANIVLAFELSAPVSTLAIAQPEAEEDVRETDFAGERGRALMTEVDRFLKACEVDKSQLSGLLVGTGPGSYTGLRIACATARSLSFALNVPVAGISSFEALAYSQDTDKPMHLVLDAYRGELYHACYQRRNGLEVLQSPRVMPREQLASVLDRQSLFVGNPPLLGEIPAVVLQSEVQPLASHLLHYAKQLGKGEVWNAFSELPPPQPQYLRAAAFRRPKVSAS